MACASDDPERPDLCGLRVEADGTTVATNGHVMAYAAPKHVEVNRALAAACGDGALTKRVEGVLTRDAVKDLLKAVPVKTNGDEHVTAVAVIEEMARTGEFSLVASPDGQTITRITGRADGQIEFPTWKSVLPSRKSRRAQMQISVQYLERIAATAKKCGVASLALSLNGTESTSDDALMAEGTVIETGQRLAFVVMGMRSPDGGAKESA